MALSLERRRASGERARRAAAARGRRGALILLLGLVLNAFPFGLPLDRTPHVRSRRRTSPTAFPTCACPACSSGIAPAALLAASLIVLHASVRRRAARGARPAAPVRGGHARAPLAAGWGAGSFARRGQFRALASTCGAGAPRTVLDVDGVASEPRGAAGLSLTATLTTLLGFAAVAWLGRGA